jgi:DNA-binding HxlR family transcriptional regulator
MKSVLPIEECDIAYALSLIGGKWKMYIISKLAHKRLRFGELKRAVPGVSEAVLISQLKELERDGLVRRIDHQTVPPHVEYELSPIASKLDDALWALHLWAEQHRGTTNGSAKMVA